MIGSNSASTVRISISEVNMSNSYIVGKDAYGKSYQVTMDFLNPVVAIPAPNELWLLRRRGTEWILDSRLENVSDPNPIVTLAPGDRRINAPGTLYLGGESVIINGVPDGYRLLIQGMIVLFNASVPPAGWAICDGSNGTPNLTSSAPSGTHYIIKL